MEYNEKELKKILKTDAKALGIPSGAADIFIERTLESVKESLSAKDLVTESDLTRLVVRELKKYHADLAYVYQNRDKIV